MASSLSSTSFILNHPYCALRIKLPRRCSFDLGLLSQSSSYHCHHRTSRPLQRSPFSLKISRSFSQSHLLHSGKAEIPSLHHFIAQAAVHASETQPDPTPVSETLRRGCIYHETYVCQMNINDIEIVLSIMKKAGYSDVVEVPENAEVIFISTCAIRDNAEQRVWQRLNYFWFLKRHWKSNVSIGRSRSLHPPKVVVLGCMAERRLKDKILDADKMVDVVYGPEDY